MDEVEALQEWVLTCSPLVQANVEVVAPKPLYHISINPKIRKFVPALSRRTAKQEDRSVSRVSVSSCITGCLFGYQSDLNDFETGANRDYLGGWYIYSWDQYPSLRPKAKILYDVEETDEHWLVPYTAERWAYPTEIIGRCFYTKTAWHWEGKQRVITADVMVEVDPGHSLQFDHELVLTEGYWSLQWTRGKLGSSRNVVKLTKSQYQNAKALTADLLSYTEPASAQW